MTAATPIWRAGGASARGASHLRTGAPNQDAIGWRPDDGAAVALAVSDGHGGRRYVSSHVGSRLSVAAALAEAETLAEAGTVDGLAARIHARWIALVEAEAAASNPDLLLEHGATMLVAFADASRLVLCQIGDGDILVGRRSGRIERVLAEDDLEGEQTHSLCEADAPRHAHALVLAVDGDDPIDFVMLSSDGLAKSFPDEAGFLALARQYHRLLAEKGLASILVALPDWLSAASANGSGDDVSLGFVLRGDLAPPPVPAPASDSAPEPAAPPRPEPAEPAATPSTDRAGHVAPALLGGLILGIAATLAAAVINPWRPWPLFAATQAPTTSAPAAPATPPPSAPPADAPAKPATDRPKEAEKPADTRPVPAPKPDPEPSPDPATPLVPEPAGGG